MLKKIAHSIIPLLFVISIMGPSIFQLCASNVDAIVINIAEEEVKEKILLVTDYFTNSLEYTPKTDLNALYVEIVYGCDSDIFLPPPEHTI